MTNKKNLNQSSEKSTKASLERRLAAYGAMSLAISAVAVAPVAQAGPVVFSPNLTTPATAPGGFVSFNVLTGTSSITSSASFRSGAAPGSFAVSFASASSRRKAWFLVSSQNTNNRFAISGGGSVARLAQNDLIGPGLTFGNTFGSLASNQTSSGGNLPFGHWNGFGSGYVGLAITTSFGTEYGWAQIQVNEDYTITLLQTGINTTFDEPIPAGGSVTPEPASLLLLASGAAGLEAYRRKLARRKA